MRLRKQNYLERNYVNTSKVVDSILIFVPCKEGVSHNPNEFVTVEEIAKGTELIIKYLIEKIVSLMSSRD